jgi:hypothetical protein
MATFKAQIANRNGYSSADVTVEGVINQDAAKRVLEARYPGAFIRAVRMTSTKN